MLAEAKKAGLKFPARMAKYVTGVKPWSVNTMAARNFAKIGETKRMEKTKVFFRSIYSMGGI